MCQSSYSKFNCLNPRIILNPLAEDYIRQYHNYFVDGKRVDVLRIYSSSFLYKFYSHVKVDNVDDYFVEGSDGRHYPLFLVVPCGHCLLCRESNANSFVQRCMAETLLYKCKPLFLTLTYNNENKPKTGVSLRHCQLFFKRLRISLCRAGYRDRIRYVLVSEYGKPENTSRPHYHAVLWNLHATDMVSYRRIKEIITKSWHYGFIRLRLVEPGDDKAFRYTAKYLRKDIDVPEGQSKPFLVASNRNGGIGAQFYRRERKKLLSRHYPKEFMSRNQFGRKPFKYFIDSYALDKMLPSISQSIPVRSSVKRYISDYVTLLYREDVSASQFKPFLDCVYSEYSDYFYLMSLSDAFYQPVDKRNSLTIIREMLDDMEKIRRDISNPNKLDRNIAKDYASYRQYYVDYVLSQPRDYNLGMRYYRIRRIREFAKQRLQI